MFSTFPLGKLKSPSPENHALLSGRATLCAVAISAGEPLVDFRAIGKIV
jgi:hypothetical protein